MLRSHVISSDARGLRGQPVLLPDGRRARSRQSRRQVRIEDTHFLPGLLVLLEKLVMPRVSVVLIECRLADKNKMQRNIKVRIIERTIQIAGNRTNRERDRS